MSFITISFYNYTTLENPEELVERLRTLCLNLKILGRILIAEEGINAALCGETSSIKEFKTFILSLFPTLTFREQETSHCTYHKLVVRKRKEIVVFGKTILAKNIGKHISPKEFHALIDNEDVLIVDARNEHEYKVGRFKNALGLPIKKFREFPEASKTLPKHKKIVLYCTGGIRCEKVSAYLKEEGFSDVSQLEGGIINYLNQYPAGHFQGGCFVFDDRLVSETSAPISPCEICGLKTQTYLNCSNLDCDKLFICCAKCQQEMNRTCSSHCKNAPRQRKSKVSKKVSFGMVQNYYSKPKIALLKIERPLSLHSKILFEGKTTRFEQTVQEIKSETGENLSFAKEEQIITIPVSQKVRKNDKIYFVP